MHKFPIWMGSVFLLPFLALSNDDNLIDRIAASLTTWQDKSPQEKIYLHTDKPYYAIGDTAWFKGYLVTGSRHQLSALSGVMYVDLINEADSVVSALRLPVTAGMCKGNFVFADGLPEGNYRVRAYTNWMRNAGADYFYDRTFSVGNVVTEAVSSRILFRDNTAGGGAELSYTDKSGAPLANRLVVYKLVSGDKILHQDRKKTDAQGRLFIAFSGKTLSAGNAYLKAHIDLDAGESSEKIFPLQNPLAAADVQFFPESGDLISGLRTRIAFKVTGSNGLGLPVRGRVLNDRDEEVALVNSVHQGMGMFTLQPEAGRTYRAIFQGEKGLEKAVALPVPKEAGYGMAVYNFPDRDSVLVRLTASESLRDKPVVLAAQASGELLMATELRPGKAFVSTYLPKKNLASGIVQFTLFTATGQAVNERLVFLQTADTMRTQLETDRKTYPARVPVSLKIRGENSLGQVMPGQFSVSVFNESVVPADGNDETGIFSQLLLSADIRGYIEKPNQYFVRKDDSAGRDLDLLMMTQAYRRFSWTDILSGKPARNPHPAEKLLDQISGTLKDLSGKPVAGGKLTLLFTKTGQMIDTLSDAGGRFVFKNMLLIEGTRISIQGRTAKNGKKVEVVLDSVSKQGMSLNPNRPDQATDIQAQIKTYLENTKLQDEAYQKNGRTGRMQLLREVQIKARKKAPEISYNMNGAGNADQVVKGEELKDCRNLATCIQGRLAGVIFRTQMIENVGPVTLAYSTRNSGGVSSVQNDQSGGAMLIVLNGRPLYNQSGESMLNISEIFDQNTINVNDIASIEVLRTPGKTAIYGNQGLNGVLLINTKGVSLDEKYDPSVVTFAARGFTNTREFYMPKYTVNTAGQQPDMRTTVYWNPDLRTDAGGKASVTFFNGDQKGTYRILLEGINERGELARQITRYTVE